MHLRCSHCGKPYFVSDEVRILNEALEFVCRSCGHHFQNPARLSMPILPVLESESQKESSQLKKALEREWTKLLEDFNNEEAHFQFFEFCRSLDSLDFATQKYRKLLALLGEDPEIEKRLRQIELLKLKTAQAFGAQQWQKKMKFYQVRGVGYLLGFIFMLLGFLGSQVIQGLSLLGAVLIIWLLLDGIQK